MVQNSGVPERPADGDAAPRRRPNRLLVAVLLGLPYPALCFPGLYARAAPALFGFPFFYWYQFAWVGVTSALLWIVYRLLRTRED